MNTETKDKLARAKSQGQAQFDSIREMVEELQKWTDAPITDDIGPREIERRVDAARETIEQAPLSVEVRSDWHAPSTEAGKPTEYCILLCTGGPAVRIIGNLSEYGEPETARMQVQDWFQPWTDFRPQVAAGNYDSEPIMLAYACCFYFGEEG